MAVNSTEEYQNGHHVVVLFLPEPDGGGGTTNNNNIAPSTVEPCFTSATCIPDVDIENGTTQTPKYKQDSIGIFISDDPFTPDSCLQMGGKFMQLLLNHFPELSIFASRDKLIPERIYDTPTNRSRKYKRSPSFNSRRVVLLFSVLSSMGTIILIYLTLRVRQMADGSINV